MRPLQKIALILLAIVLLPAIFYSLYEVNAMQRKEALLTEIYDKQLETIFFSINQFAWDTATNWASQLEPFLPEKASELETIDESICEPFFSNRRAINAIFLVDTSSSSCYVFDMEGELGIRADLIDEIESFLDDNWGLYDDLNRFKENAGYFKLQDFQPFRTTPEKESLLALLFIPRKPELQHMLAGYVISPERFVQHNLAPKLTDVAGDRFILGAFKSGDQGPFFVTDANGMDEPSDYHDLWLLPEYYLAMQLPGDSIEVIARNDFYRSLLLILLLDAVLIFGAIFLYRSVRREVSLAQLKSDFVSNVSHELKTPLALIRMFSETLQMGRVKSPEKRQEYYNIMSQETERLSHLVNKILDFSRMEAGRKQYTFLPTDINDVAESVMHAYQYQFRQDGFETSMDLTEGLPLIMADSDALKEAILNLVDNAAKYSDDEKWIQLRSYRNGDKVFLDVADRGLGMPEGETKKIFEKFYRISSGLVHDTKGSGMGLTLVKYIVEAHDGTIEVESSEGKGSCFRLSFPISEKGDA